MKRRISYCASGHARASAPGFTLVELMVALTGGLFVSLAVFALARDSGRFYQRESRIANATVSALLGFERLRTDIARAGFMASPNVVKDVAVCARPNGTWPAALTNLASIQIQATPATPILTANGRSPQGLTLAGSYTSSDIYPVRVVNNGASVDFLLIPGSTALARLSSGGPLTDQAVQAVFGTVPGRALRFVQYGKQYYGQVIASNGGTAPKVTVTNAPQIPFRGGPQGSCGANIIGSGAGEGTINVVNFIHYDLRNLSTNAQTPQAPLDYASLYSQSAAGPGEAERTELVRVEQDVTGTPLNGTEQLVAEYAVDLSFQITAVTAINGCCDPQVSLIAPGSADFARFTGPVALGNNQPELIRTVRIRLGVRSRESDRGAGIGATPPATQGLFRFNLGAVAGPEPFARVRTFQADVVLNNQADVLW